MTLVQARGFGKDLTAEDGRPLSGSMEQGEKRPFVRPLQTDSADVSRK